MIKLKMDNMLLLINLRQIESITGNARNLNVSLKNLTFSIPVSRSFPKEMLTPRN
ncbi:MAG: hypothetical protein ACPGRC_01970 [Salibacteraceae bacterium]